MRNLSDIYKDGKHFFFLEVEGEYGGTTPAAVAEVAEITEAKSDADVGNLIIKCLEKSGDFEKRVGWDDPKLLDEQIRGLGYRGYTDLTRGALFVYVYKDNDKIVFYPHKRRGGHSPFFEGVGKIFPDTSAPADLGRAFRKALSLSE